MLVIISDIHLTDGSSGDTVREGAFRLFRDTLRDLAYDASWSPEGKYEPIKELHLLLLGDILDVIRSKRWLDGKVRPWDAPSSPEFVGKVAEITRAILNNNSRSLQVLRDLDVEGDVTIPPATAAHKPADVDWEPWNSARQRVKVHRHYMVGNHDWFYHLPGPGYDSVRACIVEALGLENAPGEPFAWDPAESARIQEFCRAHRVSARHGDLYDPDNYSAQRGRDGSSIGDAIVVELINRFHIEVGNVKGISPECIRGLNEIDNIRPLTMSVVWIAGLLKTTCQSRAQRRLVKQVWNAIVDHFFEVEFVQREHSATKAVWWLSRWFSLEFLSWLILSPLGRLFNFRRSEPDYTDATGERAFVDGSAEFFVYGHTHDYMLVPLVSRERGKEAFKQVYINSGTWRPFHELARAHPQRHEFVSYELMTILAFYKPGERGGRSFETWNGSLSPAPEE